MAEHLDHDAFQEEVMQHLMGMVEAEDARGGLERTRDAFSFGRPTGEAVGERPSPAQMDALVAEATEKVVRRPEIMVRLCPALRAGGDSVWEIAKVITPGLLPLVVAGTVAIPLNAALFAAAAFVIARMGIASLCPDAGKPGKGS